MLPPQSQTPQTLETRPTTVRARLIRKRIWAALLCVAVLLVPITGNPYRPVASIFADAYRQVLGYPIVGLLVRAGLSADADGKPVEAERYLARLGPTLLELQTMRRDLAVAYRQQGRTGEAEQLLLAVNDALVARQPPVPAELLVTQEELGRVYFEQQRFAEAERSFGPSDPHTQVARIDLGRAQAAAQADAQGSP